MPTGNPAGKLVPCACRTDASRWIAATCSICSPPAPSAVTRAASPDARGVRGPSSFALDVLPELRRRLAVDPLQRLDGTQNLGVALMPEVAFEYLERHPFEQGQVGDLGEPNVEPCQLLAVLEVGQPRV